MINNFWHREQNHQAIIWKVIKDLEIVEQHMTYYISYQRRAAKYPEGKGRST